MGQSYRGDRPDDQIVSAAGVRVGTAGLAGSGRHWDGAALAVDVYQAKADAVALLAALGFDAAKAQLTQDAPSWFHPGRSATLRLGPKVILGHFGELNPGILKQLDLAGPAVAFEIFLANLPAEKRKTRARPAFAAADLLPVTRDFAFVLDQGVAAGEVVKAAQGVDKALIAGVKVFDVFEGGSLGAGKKSLAIEVTLAPKSLTLTDEEIDAVGKKVIAAVGKATGGEIRG